MSAKPRLFASFLFVLIAGCPGTKLVTFDCADPERNALSLKPASPSMPADEASATQLLATLPQATLAAPRSVTFATSAGSIVGAATVTADFCGTATALLRSPAKLGTAVVTAAWAGRGSAIDSVRFLRAWPERLDLSVDPAIISASAGRSTVTVRLSRRVGRPTAGVRIAFSARTEAGDSIGVFQTAEVLADSTIASTVFAVADSLLRKPILITAVVDTIGGQLRRTITLLVTK